MLALGGACAIALTHDGNAPGTAAQAVIGDVYVVGSAAGYALKMVFFKRWFPAMGDAADSWAIVGAMGAVNLLAVPVLLFVFDRVGAEHFAMPSARDAQVLALVAAFTMLAELALVAAIGASSPTFVAVGCLLVMPAS